MATSMTTPVLIVDDEPAIRETLRLLLADEGYTTREAADGLACMDALRASAAPLIVLLDLMMPRMSGLDVLALIARGPRSSVRHAFIVMTANIDIVAERGPYWTALLQRLSIPVLDKPFDIDLLLERVAHAASQTIPGAG
jgi:two-component system response regulator MprA